MGTRPTTKEAQLRVIRVLRGGVPRRHVDHRFEWTRDEFAAWGASVADRYPYTFEALPVGEAHERYGPPTQLGRFRRQP